MNKKAAIGASLALMLAVGAMANVASANGNGMSASAKADVRVEDKGNHGFRGALQGFFSRHQENKQDRRKEDRSHGDKDRKLDDRIGLTFGIGIVTGVDGDTITATSKKDADVTWTITTDSDTTFAFRGDDDLDVGDRIAVAGTVTDNDGDDRAIDANYVLAVDANIAKAGGTITDVNEDDNTVTVSTKHQGDVIVAINGDTEIVDADGDTGVFDDLVVGAKVRVKGMWNSLRDLVTAAKVKIVATV